jgi:hypothetical protein
MTRIHVSSLACTYCIGPATFVRHSSIVNGSGPTREACARRIHFLSDRRVVFALANIADGEGRERKIAPIAAVGSTAIA